MNVCLDSCQLDILLNSTVFYVIVAAIVFTYILIICGCSCLLFRQRIKLMKKHHLEVRQLMFDER